MSAPADLTHQTGPIGPGRLVLVVGPSGAGKDSLIAHARERCRNDPGIVFPRRIVTRPSSSAEDHDTVSAEAFERTLAAGGYALAWRAHSLSYALPLAVDDDIRAGRTLVCNISRTMIPAARARYARVSVVLITAPAEVLAQRLAARGREAAALISDRLRRGDTVGTDTPPDVVIHNVDSLEVGTKLFLDAIYERVPRPAL